MWKLLILCVSGLALAFSILSASADEVAKKQEEPKTYTVSFTVTYELTGSDSDGKPAREKVETKMPDLTTLEGTPGEYFAGGKQSAAPYGFLLQVKINPATGNKVRLEVTAESSSASGGLLNSLVQVNRQRVVRQVALGNPLKLDLGKNNDGDRAWVELTVREAKAD